MPHRTLIVNADDFGRTAGISAGILRSHREGIVTSTTVMMNLPGVADQLREALDTAPDLGMGVHLNLTFGPPCAPAEAVSSLLGPDGWFLDQRQLFDQPDRIQRSHVDIEWRTQVELFIAAGASPDHLDSHHHIALLTPEIWELHLTIAREYGCSVRTPDPLDVPDVSLIDSYPPPLLEFIRQGARSLARQLEVPHPDHFLAGFFGPTATLEHLLGILDNLPEGVSELMCHPGYTDASLESSSGYGRVRMRELEALTDPQTLKLVAEADFLLSTFRQACPLE